MAAQSALLHAATMRCPAVDLTAAPRPFAWKQSPQTAVLGFARRIALMVQSLAQVKDNL